MTRLRELSFRQVTRRLTKLGFRFYRQGKGSQYLFKNNLAYLWPFNT